jgi:hypothetical protein
MNLKKCSTLKNMLTFKICLNLKNAQNRERKKTEQKKTKRKKPDRTRKITERKKKKENPYRNGPWHTRSCMRAVLNTSR